MQNEVLELASSQLDEQTAMSMTSTSDKQRDRYGMTPEDWQRLNDKTDEEITAAALADPDAQPISPEQAEAMRRPRPLSKVVRNKLRMTRQTFGETYGIPLDTLSAWERHEAEPTPVETAYLRLIEREPERAKLVPVT